MSIKELVDILGFINILIIPLLAYVVRIERRLASGDHVIDKVEQDCPIFNFGACPANKKGICNHGEA